MNLEFDDSDQVEIHFTQKGLRRRYKGTIGGFFDRHRDGTRVGGMKFLDLRGDTSERLRIR
jgi:hypothetical protein